jgi:hypothetical protein
MMDAVKFVKTLGRMCDAECIKCEFRKRLSGFETCAVWRKTHPEEAVAIAEQWAAEHPIKTRQSEFLKLFPNAQTDSGCLNACPMDVFGNTGIDCNKRTCFECKKEFWLSEVEDV